MGIFEQLDWLTKKVKQLCCAIKAPLSINTQTAPYTLELSDSGKLININIAVPNTLTVPNSSTADFPIGTEILVAQYGAGQVTINPAAGVTLRSANGELKLTARYSGASLLKIGPNEWYVFGDLTA